MASPKRKPEPEPFDWHNPDYEPILRERAERLAYLREHTQEIQALKAYYKDNLVAFINDWGMTFDPRNAEIGLPITFGRWKRSLNLRRKRGVLDQPKSLR